jgi:glycosyltransferase involved in cell wall biosynthesis
MKKILCLYGNLFYYGHERSNVQVFNLLAKEGFDLLVLTNKKGIAPEAKQVFKELNIKHESILFPDWADVRKPFKLIGILSYFNKVIKHNFSFYKKLIKFKPDYIYIANDFIYLSLIPSFIISNKKIIYRLGDLPLTGWKPFKILWRIYIVNRTHAFVCISKFVKDNLILAGRKPNKNDIVIYNFPPIRSSIENMELPINTKLGITFGYLGQLIEIKGVDLFIDVAIEICNEYDDVYFLLAGDLSYSIEFTQRLLYKIQSANLQEKIFFLGSVENIKVFFSNIDVLVTPSIKEEPLGNVLVEAKSYNTPSIIFKSGGMPELIQHKHNGYVCEDSTSSNLKKGMKYYMDKPGLTEEHGNNAFASVKELGIGFLEYQVKWLGVFNKNVNNNKRCE